MPVAHLARLVAVRPYHRWRTHLALEMAYPAPRPVQPPELGGVIAVPEVSGLQRHYERQVA
jgi:hypothetical protein